MSRAKKLAIGTLIAGAAGYVAGLLTAPKSGKETRQDIKEATTSSLNEAEKQLKGLHTELTKLLDQVKGRSDKAGTKAQKEIKDLVDKTKDAKDKAREMLSAVHKGGANDKDLDSAITDAKRAIQHIKDYLKS